jgi:hypothetical protein
MPDPSQPLRAHLHSRATANEARHRIRDAYRDLARYYVDARDGNLSSTDSVELWG